MADFNFGGINSLLRQLPGSAQQITNAISRGFGSMPSATRQLPPGAARIGQQLPNAISPSPLSVRFNPAANLPYPPQAPFIDERIYNATRTGLTNARNALGAAVDTGRGVTNILGRAAGPSMEAVRGGLGSAGARLTNMAGGARNALGAAVDTGRGVANIVGRSAAPAFGSLGGGTLKKLGGPVITSLDVANRLRQGENPADIAISTLGGLAGGAAGSLLGPVGAIGGYVAGSNALPPTIDWLGKNAVLSDRGAINKPKSQASQAFGPAYGNVGVPSGGPRSYGADYKEKELSAGQDPQSFRAEPGFSGQSPAAERAYQAERSSVAQQAAQNPELQRYSNQATLARQSLQGYNPTAGPLPGAAQQAQDMGMAIWAKANPTLAAKVRPGQSGYGTIQNTLASSAAGAGFQAPGQLVPTPQLSASTPFPGGAPGAPAIPPGFTPGMGAEGQLSALPAGFDPAAAKIGPFAEFIKNKLKK